MPERCFLRSKMFAAHGLHGIVSLRTGGVSPPPFDSMNLAADTGDTDDNVAQNLRTLLRRTGIGVEPHRARQVHGSDCLICKGAGRQHASEADILLSRDGSPLAVRVADCVPILLADTDSGMLCAVHAGWRGTAATIVEHAVRHMMSGGAHPANIIACIGPCIGPCCFEIGEDTADELAKSCRGAEACIDIRGGRHFSDLFAINRAQLIQAGIEPAKIERMLDGPAGCTCCNARQFFSYRRDGRMSGRHLAIVAPMSGA